MEEDGFLIIRGGENEEESFYLSSNFITFISWLFTTRNINNGRSNASDLVIPTKESVSKDGYPTNENGQTYGPDMGELMLDEPDLISAIGIDIKRRMTRRSQQNN